VISMGERGLARFERRRSPAAGTAWAWLSYTALLALLGVNVIRFAAADLLSGTKPELSLWFDAGQTDARLTLAEHDSRADPPRIDDVVLGGREALRENPLSPQSLTLLARASEKKNDEATAAALMAWASRVDQRSLESQLWLLNQDIVNSRRSEAIRRLDILLLGQAWQGGPGFQVVEKLIVALAPVLTSEMYRSDFVALLRTKPKWRSTVLGQLAGRANDLPGLYRLFAALQAGENPPSRAEWEPVLTRLAKEGPVDQAYLAWTETLPPERLSKLDFLYNARFQYPITNLPFDWVFAPAPGALVRIATENDRLILKVDFFGGRIRFAHVSHLLALAPGRYRFSGRERSESLKNERGLRWRLACVGSPARMLGATDPLIGDTAWRAFGVDFEVPMDNCGYQELVLELPAQAELETEIAGGVSYADLDIRPK
jgi:hypothetical protein